MKRHTFEEIYKEYTDKFYATAAKVKKAGGVPPIEPMSRTRLKLELSQEKMRIKARGGKASSDIKLVAKIGREDALPYTEYQAEKFREQIAEKSKERVSLSRLRMIGIKNTKFEALVSNYNKQLKEQGIESDTRAIMISQEFYGSN
ncbi:MAG: hypothetical protein MJZ03_04040 [archaeon]|nr:hypothetical protein [archaeon]